MYMLLGRLVFEGVVMAVTFKGVTKLIDKYGESKFSDKIADKVANRFKQKQKEEEVKADSCWA